MGIIIGIGGVSRAGKTTLGKLIRNWYSDLTISILEMDAFVFPESQIPKIRNEVDWEIPASVDFKSMALEISRKKSQNDMVIVEGILIFYDDILNALFDRKIFIDLSYEDFIARKLLDTRWNEPEWYIQHIWTSYIIYGRKNVEDALLISGNNPFRRKRIKEFIGCRT